MKFPIVAFFAVAAGIATAQTLNDAPDCAKPCVQNEAQAVKCSVTDTKCLCSKVNKARLVQCVKRNCNDQDMKKCIGLATTACSN